MSDNNRVTADEPTTVRDYPRGTLVAEHRMSNNDYEDQLLALWQHVARKIATMEATPHADPLTNVELAMLREQRDWIQLFFTRGFNDQAIVNPNLPIAQVFLDEQCPVIVAAWGPASPTCAVLLLMNELPQHPGELSAQLDRLRRFVTLGPPGCVGVALFSAVTKLGSQRFDHPETFLVEDPAAVLRATLSVDHTRAARRYYAGRMALPAVLVAIGNGLLQPRSVKDHIGKREFTRRPNAHVEIREIMTAPLSHLGPDLWHRLQSFTHLVELREIARVKELLADFHSKQQFLRGVDQHALGDFSKRTLRELNFTVGWKPEIVNQLLEQGIAPIEKEFAAWKQRTAEQASTASKEKPSERIAAKPRRGGLITPRILRPVTAKPIDKAKGLGSPNDSAL